MKSVTFIFECADHEDYGCTGWKLTSQPHADPLRGMAVAHDCLEHPINGNFQVEDELLALGASLYVREYTTNMHSLGKNVAGDLPDVLRHAFSEGMGLRSPGVTQATAVEHEIDDAIEGLADEGKYDLNLKENLDSETRRYIRGWMRRGYRWAAKRWKGIRTREIFQQIEQEADKHIKWAEVGDRLFVRLTFSRGLITDQRSVDVKIWSKQQFEEEYQ